jgi:hypothetical protein
MSDSNDRDDPEASYRRGYEQGAREAVEAAEKLALLPNGLGRLRRWTTIDLRHWRYVDRLDNRSVHPPAPPN